jgi:hypothetical protein
MAILITVETLALGLLTLLVAGLLRSHAEILRRLATLDGSAPARNRAPVAPAELPPARHGDLTPAFDVVGTTLAGDPVKVAVPGARTNTLLAFLSSGCLSCRRLWEGSGAASKGVASARLVLVTKDRSEESPSRIEELAQAGVTLVMSSAAWKDYGVNGSPYFIYVDGPSGQVHSEGTATNWDQVLSLLRDAIADDELAPRRRLAEGSGASRLADGSADRIRRADAELAAAGILPGHPSLWPDSGGAGGTGTQDGT